MRADAFTATSTGRDVANLADAFFQLLGDVADLNEALLRHVEHEHFVRDAKAVLGVGEGSLAKLVLAQFQ